MNEIIRDAGVIAGEINAIKQEVRDTAIRGPIEIGKRLIEAKNLVPYGQWGKWLEENVDYSERTAQEMMRIAQEYGRKETQALAEIQNTTQAVLLLALESTERDRFVQEHDMKTISTRELEAEIHRLKEEKAKAQLTIEELLGRVDELSTRQAVEADETPEPADYAEELEAARERAEKLEAQLAEAQKKAEEAKKSAESAAQAREKAVKANNSLQEQLDSKISEMAHLETDLKEAREAVKTVEVVPEAVEKELEALRRKAAASGAESEMRAAFDNLKAAFERLTDKVNEAEETDGELALKYRGAFHRAMLTMADRIK